MADNVYDKAHQLARALRESAEYHEYREAYERLKERETAWKMLEDFRRRWLEFEAARLSGEEVPAGGKEELEEQQRSLLAHTSIAAFLKAEARLGTLMEDIQGILAQTLEIEDD